MKNIVRFFIISLALFGCCFASLEKISHDSLENCFRILAPKNIAQLQRTCKDFKKVSERVYKNVPLKTMHNIIIQGRWSWYYLFKRSEDNGHNILKLYNHVKNLERNEPFQRTNQTDEAIANAYTLALVTQNKKVRNRLEDEYKNLLKQKSEKEKNLFFNKVFRWAGKHNFFKTPEQKKEIITVFHTFFNNDLLNLYFQQISLDEIKADNRDDVLYNAVVANLENIVEQMLNSHDFTNLFDSDQAYSILKKAIKTGSENIIERIIPNLTTNSNKTCSILVHAYYILKKAINSESENVVERIFNIPNIINVTCVHGRGALLYKAVESDSENIVEKVLNSPNFIYYGISKLSKRESLEIAVEKNNTRIVKLLLNSFGFTTEQLKQEIQKTSDEKIKELLVAKLPWLPWLKRKIKNKIKNLLKQN